MIPEVDLARVRKWIEARNANMPEHARGQIRYELDVTDRTVTILECRPPWRPAYGPEWTRSPVARLRYTKSRAEWSLYWADHTRANAAPCVFTARGSGTRAHGAEHAAGSHRTLDSILDSEHAS